MPGKMTACIWQCLTSKVPVVDNKCNAKIFKLNESIANHMGMALRDKLCKWYDGVVLYAACFAAPLLL